MKKIVTVIFAVLLVITASTASAQKSSKIGHVDFGKVLENMPGQDTVKIVLEKYVKSLQDQLLTMQSEYENKAADYQKNVATMSSIIKATKEKELSDLQDRIQAFQQSAQQELSAKQTELITPFVDKVKHAIKDVAKENGFSYIINSVEDILLYSDGGEDVTPLVKKKLGITK